MSEEYGDDFEERAHQRDKKVLYKLKCKVRLVGKGSNFECNALFNCKPMKFSKNRRNVFIAFYRVNHNSS